MLARRDYEALLAALWEARSLREEERERLEGRLSEQARLTLLAVRDLAEERGARDLSKFVRDWIIAHERIEERQPWIA